MNEQEARQFFTRFKENISWTQHSIHIFGKNIPEPRLSAFYADNGVSYTYSRIKRTGLSWTDDLLFIKSAIENRTKQSFNSCLLNYYRSGKDSMGWHSDNEPELGLLPVVASLSLGSDRVFQIKSKLTPSIKGKIILENGSLLLMKKGFQENFLHQIPKSLSVDEERINLTFRKII